MGPCLVSGIKWVYNDSRLGTHIKAHGFDLRPKDVARVHRGSRRVCWHLLERLIGHIGPYLDDRLT